MADGLTNAQIAERLGVSLSGAKWHVSEVLSRLGVCSREEASDVWKASARPAARARRGVGVALGFGAWRVAGGVGLVSALGAAAVVARVTWASDDDAGSPLLASLTATAVATEPPRPPLAVAPAPTSATVVPKFTEAEARDIADRMARELLARRPDITSLGVGGHYLGFDDFTLADHGFQYGSVVGLQLASRGRYWLGVDQAAWVFSLQASVDDWPVIASRVLLGVAFEDGTGTPLISDVIRPEYEASTSEAALRGAMRSESSVAEAVTSDGRWRVRMGVADGVACAALVSDEGAVAANCFTDGELAAVSLSPLFSAPWPAPR